MGLLAWNDWYHCTANTYGTWLRGDGRGWRTRHHREHVEGDYRNPPAPGTFELTRALSLRLMKRPPVRISRSLRQVVVDGIALELEQLSCDVVVASMDASHLHVLARFRMHDPRVKLGIAKKRATQHLKAHCSAVGLDLNLKLGEGIWGKRSKATPIKSRAHQVTVVRYIIAHGAKGASIWRRDRDGLASDA